MFAIATHSDRHLRQAAPGGGAGVPGRATGVAGLHGAYLCPDTLARMCKWPRPPWAARPLQQFPAK